jgi:undecaprenyl-diphosphatase
VSESLGPSPGQALLLGLVQGPAELLPVSSSGHIALISWLAKWGRDGIDPELGKSFEIALHAGTAAALPLVMHDELRTALDRLGSPGIASTGLSISVPALVGYALERPIERRLSGPGTVAAGLLCGAVAMIVVDRRTATRRLEQMRPSDGLALGIAEAFALMPGVSRNGATLALARARGFDRRDADSLSWLAAMPVILGASTLKGLRLARRGLPEGAALTLASGVGASFCSTLIAGKMLRRKGSSPGSLVPYALYRCVVALLVIGRLRRALADDGARMRHG